MMTTFLIFFPLCIGLLLFLVRPAKAHMWALAAALIEFIASLVIAFEFNPSAGPQFSFDYPWITSLGLNFAVGIDGINLPLVLLTTTLVPLIILTSFPTASTKPAAFYGLMLSMQMALIGVFTAYDGLLFYLFWEAALIPIYFLCLLWGGEDRGRITFKFFVYTLSGSLFMLVALIYLYFQTPGTHTFAMEALYQAGRALPAYEQGLIFWALFVAFAIKMPIFPFHTWQPDTYTVAPAQGTMLLSGLMLKMGLFGVIRWLMPVVPEGVTQWHFVATVLAVIGIVYASCMALVQRDFKRLVAYSSIAHVGLIAAGLLTGTIMGVQGALVQMVSHGILVVSMFFIVEQISTRAQTRMLHELGGMRNVAPILATTFLVTLLGSVALPLTSGFIGEFMLITALTQYEFTLGATAGLSIILGAVYMLVAFQRSMSGEVTTRIAACTDLTGTEKWVLYPLVILIILMGVHPTPLLALSDETVQHLLQSISATTASVNGL